MNTQDKDGRSPTARHTAKTVFHSWGMSILASLTWAATAAHAASSASIVSASYFTAWVTRMQHRLLLFFAAYGGAVLPDEEPTEEEISAAQRGGSTTDAENWTREDKPVTPSEPPNMFGGRPPKGQA